MVRTWPGNDKIKSFDTGEDIYALRWLVDGGGIITSGGNDGGITIRRLDGQLLERLPPKHKDSVVGLTITSDGTRWFRPTRLGKIWLWNLAKRETVSAFPIEPGVGRDTVAIASGGRDLLVAGNDGDVIIYYH